MIWNMERFIVFAPEATTFVLLGLAALVADVHHELIESLMFTVVWKTEKKSDVSFYDVQS